jgi:hypothetical protein
MFPDTSELQYRNNRDFTPIVLFEAVPNIPAFYANRNHKDLGLMIANATILSL